MCDSLVPGTFRLQIRSLLYPARLKPVLDYRKVPRAPQTSQDVVLEVNMESFLQDISAAMEEQELICGMYGGTSIV